MMRALKLLVLLCTFSYVWTIDIFIDGPVDLLDCRSHDDTNMFGSTTTSRITEEATETPKAPSEGRIISVGNEEFLVVTTQRVTWRSARAWCRDNWGGDLASPSDPQALSDRLIEEGLPRFVSYWLGGQRGGDGWSWVNGQYITGGWAGEEPKSSGDCVRFYPRYGSWVHMYAWGCHLSAHIICEQ